MNKGHHHGNISRLMELLYLLCITPRRRPSHFRLFFIVSSRCLRYRKLVMPSWETFTRKLLLAVIKFTREIHCRTNPWIDEVLALKLESSCGPVATWWRVVSGLSFQISVNPPNFLLTMTFQQCRNFPHRIQDKNTRRLSEYLSRLLGVYSLRNAP